MGNRTPIAIATVFLAATGCYSSIALDEVATRDGDEPVVVEVAAFGAVPDDGACDLVEVRQALKTAVQSPDVTLRFEPGVYDFNCFGNGANAALELFGETGVRLLGNNTSIQIDDLSRTFLKVDFSADITIEGLDVRWTTLPFTQGFVESLTADGMVIVPSIGMPEWTDARFDPTTYEKVDISVMHVNDRRRIKARARQNYSVETLSSAGGRVQATVSTMDTIVAPGDPVVLRVRHPTHVLAAFKSKRIVVKDVSVAQSPGIIVSGSHNEVITIDGLTNRIQPGHWTAGSADGMNLGGTKGPVVIENCALEGLGDDFINLHGRRMRVASKVDARTIDLFPDQVMLAPGDEITVLRPSTGAKAGGAKVLSSSALGNGNVRVVIDANISAAFGAGDLLFNESRMSNGFRIENNSFRYGQRHGVVVRGNGGEIRSNTFRSLGSKGIGTQSDLLSIEGYRLSDTLIEGNDFRDVALSSMSANASIYITAKRTSGGGVFQWRANEGIRILSNTFKTYQGAAVVIEAGKHNEIDDNVLLAPTASFLFSDNAVFKLYNVNQTSITNNAAAADTRNHGAFVKRVGAAVQEAGNDWQ